MKENKNAVIIAWRDMWHPQQGGAEIYITKVAHKLRDSGYNVTFFTEQYKDSKPEEVIDNIKYIRRGNSISLHLEFPKYYKKYLKDNTDLLIENFNAVPFYVPKINRNNITVIHHVQDQEWIKAYGKIFGKLISTFFKKELKRVYGRNQKIVTVSPSSLEELRDIGFGEKNISIIYNGIEVPIVSEIDKPRDQVNIVSIGRIKNTKHIEEAIEMLKLNVDEGITNIKLDIAGKGEDEDRLKDLVKKYNLEKFVNFLGFISESQKVELLKNAHLHIQFSRKEGWGITVIEAAACATPTICYRVPGLVDSVKDSTGYFIDDTLKETWNTAIKDIQENNERYISKQKECIEWASQFNWDKQMGKFIDLVKEE